MLLSNIKGIVKVFQWSFLLIRHTTITGEIERQKEILLEPKHMFNGSPPGLVLEYIITWL